jgi:glycosyltransferase involved in cell wall biosynthesis
VDVVAANSVWTREQLVAEGIPDHHIQTIIGGVDTSIFQPAPEKAEARHKLGLPENGMIILTAGNLVGEKGFDTVLKVVAQLSSRHPSLFYVIVGDGPDETHLRHLAADLGVEDRTIFVGRKPQEELARHYQAANLYVQVSVETMGRTYMEAGACGIPVVAAKVGGVPSVVMDNVNGLLVNDPQDQDTIAEAIVRLLTDPELRQRMGQAGLEMAREKYSWERVTVAFEDAMVNAVGSA